MSEGRLSPIRRGVGPAPVPFVKGARRPQCYEGLPEVRLGTNLCWESTEEAAALVSTGG